MNPSDLEAKLKEALRGLDSIAETPPIVVDQEAETTAAGERRWLENERLRSENRDIDQDRDERRKYAHRVFCLVVGWLSAMLLIVAAYGVRLPKAHDYIGFEIPDAVIITLITTTTASVVGIFLIVATYLFPKR